MFTLLLPLHRRSRRGGRKLDSCSNTLFRMGRGWGEGVERFPFQSMLDANFEHRKSSSSFHYRATTHGKKSENLLLLPRRTSVSQAINYCRANIPRYCAAHKNQRRQREAETCLMMSAKFRAATRGGGNNNSNSSAAFSSPSISWGGGGGDCGGGGRAAAVGERKEGGPPPAAASLAAASRRWRH